MLFIVHYEFNPNLNPEDMFTAYQKIAQAEIDLGNSETKSWYITPEHWGVAIIETDSVESMMKNAYMWRVALPGLFKTYNIAPVAEIEEIVPLLAKMMRKINK